MKPNVENKLLGSFQVARRIFEENYSFVYCNNYVIRNRSGSECPAFFRFKNRRKYQNACCVVAQTAEPGRTQQFYASHVWLRRQPEMED
jgi:hypothetical protein